MDKKAFTLAEVLITLVIIGIIAALTIPNLIQNTQKKELTVALRKFYSATNQALLKLTYDESCSGDLKCTGIFDNGNVKNMTAHVKAGSAIAKYYKLSQECGQSEGCWTPTTIRNYDGTGGIVLWGDTNYYRFATADGMSVLVLSEGANCDLDYSGGSANVPTSEVCGQMYVDVNGKKGPNRMGRDTFLFWITNGKGAAIYPYGGIYDGANGSWSGMGKCLPEDPFGYFCAARIMDEGWEMKY